MSLVVAIKKDDVVYFGADTRVSIEGGDVSRCLCVLAEDELKIQRMGSCFVGTAGYNQGSQLFLDHPEWFELKGKPLTKRFIVQNVIPKFYDLAKEMYKLTPAVFLVTDGKKLFKINDDFEVVELSRYGQIGCTKTIALALILSEIDNCSPNEIILNALRESAYRNNYVGAPFVLINTRDNKFEFVEE